MLFVTCAKYIATCSACWSSHRITKESFKNENIRIEHLCVTPADRSSYIVATQQKQKTTHPILLVTKQKKINAKLTQLNDGFVEKFSLS